jgi:septum formation protein
LRETRNAGERFSSSWWYEKRVNSTVPAAPDLILASASPRRRELLQQLGLRIEIRPANIDESTLPGESARTYVERVSAAKCAAIESPGLAVLAADTTVAVDGVILGKPADEAEAREMLSRLAGRRHEVLTAYCIRHNDRRLARTVSTQVSMRLIDEAEIAAYVACGEWRDKAGGYAVQGIAAVFVTEVRGSITNVIGLPIAEVIADLRALKALPGYPAPGFGVKP